MERDKRMKISKAIGAVLALQIAVALFLPACSAPAGTPAASKAAAGGAASSAVTAAPSPAATDKPAPTPAPSPVPTASPAPTATPEPVATATPAPTVEPGAPDAIGIYRWDRRQTYTLVKSVNEKWPKGKDLIDYYVIASNAETVTGSSHKSAFENVWKQFPEASKYKIGFRVSFGLKSGETVTLIIRSPKDAPKDPKKYFYQFVEVYMYDDLVPIDTKSGKRMHMTENKMKPTTLFTAIKLTAGSKIAEVTDIKLAAFIYSGDGDFDPSTGEYTGSVIYELPISRS